MAIDPGNFVNGCRNIVWLAGYVRRQEDGTVLLSQREGGGNSDADVAASALPAAERGG